MTSSKTNLPLTIPRSWELVVRPFRSFCRTESASSLLLVATSLLAFAWANSRFSASYHWLVAQKIGVSAAGHRLDWALDRWINDGLMTAFFFVVGMEIKRELVVGQLSEIRRALLPAIAAAGGMLVPALTFTAIAQGTTGTRGWGIPVATDIAFSLACLALLRDRIPASLVAFLAALAIFDDLGAVLVLALGYGRAVHWAALAAAGTVTGALVILDWCKVQRPWPYLVLGAMLWLAVLGSGVHATLAGAVLGLCIPAGPGRDPADARIQEAGSVLDRLLSALHPWVAFLVVPVFALVNAGVTLPPSGKLATRVSLGVAAGLFLGKQAGIFATTLVAVKVGWTPMPQHSTWRQLYGVAVLGGIGFTMSLFVGALAFGQQPALEAQAKIGILAGSLMSATGGLLLLRFSRPA